MNKTPIKIFYKRYYTPNFDEICLASYNGKNGTAGGKKIIEFID